MRFRRLFVKKGTPKEIVTHLQAVFKEAYNTMEHQAFIKRKSLDIVESYRSPADARKEVEGAIATYANIFKHTRSYLATFGRLDETTAHEPGD